MAAGFDVLRTSRNISILLAAIQIITVLLLSFIFVALFGLLITVSPDLEDERRAIVTPAVQWLSLWIIDRTWIKVLVWTLFVGCLIGGTGAWYLTRSTAGADVPEVGEPEDVNQDENVDA